MASRSSAWNHNPDSRVLTTGARADDPRVLEIHRDQIERYGGDPGLRDQGLLESAVAMPAAGMRGRYFHEDLFEMAAAYLFYIVGNHPFVDGNKRAGAETALVFLYINGIEVNASEDDLVAITLAVAKGQAGKAEAAGFFRENPR